MQLVNLWKLFKKYSTSFNDLHVSFFNDLKFNFFFGGGFGLGSRQGGAGWWCAGVGALL